MPPDAMSESRSDVCSCQRSHLLPGTITRLLAQGIPADLIEDAREYELLSHGPVSAHTGLTSAGRRNLLAWGASPDQIDQIAQREEPTPIDYYARDRQRVAAYRARLDPSVIRARNRANSQRYRERRRQSRDEGRDEGTSGVQPDTTGSPRSG